MEFLEILFGAIIINFFGYYTLLFFFKIVNNKEKIEWLKEARKNDSTDLSKGCLVAIVGIVSFLLTCFIIAYLADNFFM